MPTREQILEFIETSDRPAGKREIAKAFSLRGQQRIALKKLLRDMAEEGLIEGSKSAFHRMGGVPRVAVLRVVEIEDGEAIAVPENWDSESGKPPPRLALREARGKTGARRAALKPGDRVLARTSEGEHGWLAYPIKKLPSRSEALLGVVEIDQQGRAWLAPVDKGARNSWPISDLNGAKASDLVRAEPAGRHQRAGVKVIEVLGDALAPRNFSLIAIAKYGIPHIFPEDVLEEARIAAQLPLHPETREDLRDLPIIAIDPADARDHDDAIWAQSDGKGGFRAIVAIADVSYYVRPSSKLDREARKRGNSVYFPDRVVPMLPKILSADVCSLKQGQDRAAMVCHMHISEKGQVSDCHFTRAIVRIDENIAYEDAQAAIDEGRASDHLKALWDCWGALSRARKARDPLELEIPERRVVLDDQGRIVEIALRERLDAHRVVEDFMIAANVAAAKALESKGAPVVYRVHEPPSREKLIALREYMDSLGRKLALGQVITPGLFNRLLKDVSDDAEKLLVMEAVLRTQMQAHYTPANAGHFGLHLGSYAHFTSPIRRYADLLVHRALVDAYGLEQPPPPSRALPRHTGLSKVDRDNLANITEALSTAERRAMEAERDTIDRYIAAWLSDRVGEVFETRITGVQAFGFFVTIVGLGGDGLVLASSLGKDYYRYDEAARALIGERTGTRFEVGQRLKLRLVEANPISGALRFELAETGEEGEADEQGNGARSSRRGRGGGANSSGSASGDGHKDGARKRGTGQGRRGRPGNIRHQGRRRG